MRIIIDWCDWTGKTTLIKELKKILPKMKVIKFWPPKTEDPYSEWIEYYTPWNKKYIWDDVILDRCWISEVIYWKMFNRKPITLDQQVDFIYETKDDLYIITYTNIDNIEEVFKKRWEDFINIWQASHINYYFKKFWEKLKENDINVVFYDFKKYNNKVNLFVKKLLKWLENL